MKARQYEVVVALDEEDEIIAVFPRRDSALAEWGKTVNQEVEGIEKILPAWESPEWYGNPIADPFIGCERKVFDGLNDKSYWYDVDMEADVDNNGIFRQHETFPEGSKLLSGSIEILCETPCCEDVWSCMGKKMAKEFRGEECPCTVKHIPRG